MISLLVKLSIALKPFHKLTYLLALLVVANVFYQLLFSTESIHINNKEIMLSLLILTWLALINLMFQLFTRIPEKKENKQAFFAQIKSKLHQGLYYILSLVFIGLSIALVVLSVKMLRV